MGNVANIWEECWGQNDLLTQLVCWGFLRKTSCHGGERSPVLTEGPLMAFGLEAGGQGCYFEPMFLLLSKKKEQPQKLGWLGPCVSTKFILSYLDLSDFSLGFPGAGEVAVRKVVLNWRRLDFEQTEALLRTPTRIPVNHTRVLCGVSPALSSYKVTCAQVSVPWHEQGR